VQSIWFEVDLANALGISRTPVREAINRLEKEGLVEIFPQRGAYVVQFSEKDIFELFLIFLIMAVVLMIKPQGLFGS
jgi:DNA-binding GntR family transcriptional regulator